MVNKTYVIGDIHGELDKFKACLDSVDFDYDNDKLIQLGDVVDRGSDSYGVVEELLKIKNLVTIRGNHDQCWYYSLLTGEQDILWNQGGKETHESYVSAGVRPEVHFDLFKNQVNYYIDEDLNLFIHGGFNRHHLIEDQLEQSDFYWDRDLIMAARSYESMQSSEYKFKIKGSKRGQFKEIFVGHTPVQYFGETKPVKYANIYCLDTGAGKYKEGTVTIMNLETKEYNQF